MRFAAATTLTCALLLAAGCGWFGDDTPPLEEGFQSLFNGENLEGWHKIGGEATFEVEGGDIVGTHGPGDNTFLRTERVFADFVLKLQVKFDEPGNSGILFRAQQRPGNGRAFGYQYELDTSKRSWSGGIYDEARRGWLHDLADNAAAREAFKPQGWNDVVIEAVGASIKTWINDVPAANLVDALDLSGYIALQVHAGGSGIIRWRNIRIQDLGEHRWQGEEIADVDAWQSNAELAITDNALVASAAAGPIRISSRRELSDYALRFSLPACPAQTVVKIRSSSGETTTTDGLSLAISEGKATLHAAGLAEPLGEAVFDEIPAFYQIDIAAIGDQVSVSVNERLLGRAKELALPDRGKLVLQADPCQGKLVLADLQWLDLRKKSSETLFYQTLQTPPAPVLSPEQALQGFRLAPGFDIELVAAEPLVEDPVAMAWDEDGRLYVVEMRGFMPDAYGEGQELPVGRVTLLEDEDGDGRMDSSHVYLDELVNPRAVAVINEGILIGEPPNLWLCKDHDGDNTCDEKIRLADYAAHGQGNIEHMENGLLMGLDNWIYNAMSNRRLKLVKGELVESSTIPRGQWGLSQDDQGRLYYNNNSTFLLGDLFPAEYLLVDGKLRDTPGIADDLGSGTEGKAEVFSIRVNPGVNRAYIDGILKADGRLAAPTAVSGLAVYRGGRFPTEFDQGIFVPEPGANVVAFFRSEQDGMNISASHMTWDDEQWGQREFLASTDERFRPVDARVGPDGALYIIDMYRGIIQEKAFLTDELREQIFERDLDKPLGKGRIWRISHRDMPLDSSAPAFSSAPRQDLIAALNHDNGWRRDTAQRLLVADAGAAPALRAAVLSAPKMGAIHALWVLQAQAALDRDTVMAAIARDENQLTLQALRAGAEQLQVADLLRLLKRQATTAVQQQLVFNLASHGAEEPVQSALLDSLGNGSDPYISAAVLHTLGGHEQGFLSKLLQDERWQREDASRSSFLTQLSSNTYRSIRPALDSTDPAPEALHGLLELTGQQSGKQSWRQRAMLAGFGKLASGAGFKPADMGAPPALFNDSSIEEDDPLWQARLDGRRAFTWPGDELAAGLKPLSPRQLAQLEKGRQFYATCASCHGAEGQGVPGLAPALVATSWVLGPPEWLARIVLQGMTGPIEIDGQTWNGVMPNHADQPGFDDDTAAGLLTYIRRSWGNSANPVSADLIAEVRRQTTERNKPWTAAELRTVPYYTGFEKYVGKYKVSFVTFTIRQQANDLFIEIPMYGSGPLVHDAGAAFVADPEGQNLRIEFDVATDDTVSAMFVYRDGQKIRAERVE